MTDRKKKELDYFYIGNSYGGNQDWFHNPMMHLGGCGAATACDSCLYFEMKKMKKNVYPYEFEALDKKSYEAFAMMMRPYLRPRWGGIDTLDIYMDGMRRYLLDRGNSDLKMSGFDGNESVLYAEKVVKQQMEHNVPVPFLLLSHKNQALKDFHWHWFLLVGYEERADGLYVKAATYGEAVWLSLRELWNTGYQKKGGMILYR
ncbi:MAG: hypothetical protein PHQ72_05885 [Hespellia sp.]|nr:hypothetical protein [Hespellia sp.]